MALSGNTGGVASAGAIKAGEAFFEITGHDEQIKAILKNNIERVKVFARTIQSVGIGAAGVGAAIFTPLAAVFKSSLDRAADTGKLAARLNTSTETLSALGYAAEASGVQVEDWVKAAEKMQQASLQAAKGGVDQAAALQLIGTNAQDFARLPLEEKFMKVAGALEGMTNPLEKQMVLSGLFGDEFGKLLPLFSKGRAGIRALMEEAGQVGSVINSEDAKQAIEINKELAKAWTSVKNVLYEVGLAVLNLGGEIKEGNGYLLQYLSIARDFIRSNREIIAVIALVGAGLIMAGTSLAAFGFAITGIIAGITSLIAIGTVVIGAVFSPLALKIVALTAVIAGLIYAFTEFTATGQQVKAEFVAAWETIQTTFVEAFGAIVNALKSGDLALAGEIAITALEVAWRAGLVALTDLWIKFKRSIIEGWLDIQGVVEEAVAGFQVAFTWITEGRKAAEDLAEGLRQQLDKMRDEDRKRREEFRAGQMDEARGKLADAKKRFNDLTARANAPRPGPVPTPKDEEELRRKAAISLGDSVKGTFSSADFKGSLGLGKANEAAKKQYEIAKQQLAVLIDINKKIEPGVFQ